LFAAPGNPGIAEVAKCIAITSNETEKLATFVEKQQIDLTVVGPETPLALGIVDRFQKRKLRIFGPTQKAAKIETSKSFAKELLTHYDIPTAKSQTFVNPMAATTALDEMGPPWVIKADGLASGKGTTVTADRQEAEAAIHRELKREPGKIIMEQFIDGWEASFIATVSAGRLQWLAPVLQDYKPAFDDDVGPNTGGMGVYTPVPTVTKAIIDVVHAKILSPVLKGLEEMKIHYQGILYLNTIVPHGKQDPYVLEFNARFGDPEAQGIVPLVTKGFATHLKEIADDSTKPLIPEMSKSASVVVVLAARGYPTNPSIEERITIKQTSAKNVTIFQAGTARSPNGELITTGGRIINVVATGNTVGAARKNAYSTIKNDVYFNGMQYRSDIGLDRPRRRKLDKLE
jgi:phosphoribosylamine---glycine ligase